MKMLFPLLVIGFFSYLLTMNSTENRQSLTDDSENFGYVQFRRNYFEKTGDSSEYVMTRCYTVYQGLVNQRLTSGSNDEIVKKRLISMGLCDLDEGELVLKGFHIEDNLRDLVVSPRRMGKK